MYSKRPRLVMAALRGSAGKTTLAVALASALKLRGHPVFTFKKGPDYIDAAWLSLAASNCCRNLDTYMTGHERVMHSFAKFSRDDSISIVEGNRGLYDGVNAQGEHSTAALAKLLNAPVILVIDCDKVTRTMAAMVLGCIHLDRAVDIRGVILNRVGGIRHAGVVSRAVEESCGLPVLGSVPRIADIPFAERHLGLIPPQESMDGQRILKRAASIAEENIDIDALIRVANDAQPLPEKDVTTRNMISLTDVQIGVIRDKAFQFYYPENLEELARLGACLIRIDALQDSWLPDLDAIYIGGGFPEVHAERLSNNRAFLLSLREAAENGLPVYAECGGLIYLGISLHNNGRDFPMAGILPLRFEMEKKPQWHGYTDLEVDRENPFFPVGTSLRGHEFHYCRPTGYDDIDANTVFRIRRGLGFEGRRDGYCRKNILAAFTHLHSLGTPEWAKNMVARATQYKMEKSAAIGRDSIQSHGKIGEGVINDSKLIYI